MPANRWDAGNALMRAQDPASLEFAHGRQIDSRQLDRSAALDRDRRVRCARAHRWIEGCAGANCDKLAAAACWAFSRSLTEHAVLASEIEQLPDLAGFLKTGLESELDARCADCALVAAEYVHAFGAVPELIIILTELEGHSYTRITSV